MKKFTQQEVRQGVKDSREDYSVNEIYDVWMNMAGDWFANDDGTYLRDGFTGYNDRSEDDILLDFHFGDKLSDPLTPEEIDKMMSAKES